MRVAGVDGCPGGWIAAVVDIPDPEGAALSGPAAAAERWPAVTWHYLVDAGELPRLVRAYGLSRLGVDIPIGLPDGGLPRAADGAARRRLPGRAASVFPTPVRAVLAAASYAEACALSRARCGRALSKQTWFITPKIGQMDATLTREHDEVIAEVHPEVSFAAMAGGLPAPSKKTAAGRDERVRRLAPWLGPAVPGLVSSAPRQARADDALDALACAWSAWRWALGRHEQLGDPLARDARGHPMRILC